MKGINRFLCLWDGMPEKSKKLVMDRLVSDRANLREFGSEFYTDGSNGALILFDALIESLDGPQ